MKALIVVDLQNDFANKDGALSVPDGDKVVPVANRLITSMKFDQIVLTQDWHFPAHKCFFSNHEGKKPFDIIDLNGVQQTLWPVHCITGSPGSDFHKNLLTGRANLILRKGINNEVDSYSGFRDNLHGATGLEEYLNANGITETYITGLATDYCIKFTSIDSHHAGFKTHLVVDGCRAVNINPDDGAKAIEEMKSIGVIVVKSDDLLKQLNQQGE